MDHLAILFVELGAVFTALSALGAVARRAGLSPIPLFLIAGLAFGDGGLVHLGESESFVEVGAEIGVILLLLTLGLEFSATELMSSLRLHRSSGIVDLLLNAPPGFIAGLLLGLPWQGALAMAGVTWISSSGIVARVLSDLGRLGNRETPGVLSVLVLEDIAMALYLPVLVVVLSGGGPLRALAGVAMALSAVLLVLLAAHRAGHRVGRMLTHEDDEQVMLRVLGLTLLVAGLAQGVGASAAVGAFLVGIAIPQDLAERARGILAPLRDLFASVFFIGFGLATDPGEVLPALPAAIVLALVTAATKVATGWYAAGRAGVRARGRLRAGTALIARGEFSIVIAGLAASGGIGAVGPLAAAYVMVLAVLGPVLTRFVEPLYDRFAPVPAPPTPVTKEPR
ncbi:cation:proton antiporter [Actinomycetota bacterium]